ncbi:hypothetical protein BGZ70_009858 [Mortierella alpina]|uniref:Secreted protein n=1 Tax=Mortierella alpina TaxID=64518 RepID=A0A9P6J0D7_MORAP|nr:hypothetical protein BGZ70_009858 [Mortierella alpina]
MFLKKALLLVAAAAPLISGEKLTCTRNDTQILKDAKHITASITDANNFCTMLTGYGVKPVAENEGCGEVYCHGEVKDDGHPMPEGYILSSNYLKTPDYVQITGCIDSSVWAQDPLDDGGQMDSHGWPFHCAGYKKFVSLLEPSSNTFCLRCCVEKENVHCNTSISTHGCYNVIPGNYTMADGSECKPPTLPPGTKPSATSPPQVTPTGPSQVVPPKVNPPKVNPPKVNPPKVKPPKVNPPKVQPSKGKPPKGKQPKARPSKGKPSKGTPPKVVRPPRVTSPKVKQPKVNVPEAVKPMGNTQQGL